MQPSDVFLDEGLGRGGCICSRACQREVRTFRATGSSSREAGINFMPMLPRELVGLPPLALAHGLFALATFDLDAYANYEALMEAARTSTEKRGRINREIARAEKNGYYVKAFPFALHVPDIVAIHQSKDTRDGRAIRGKFYHQTVDELGGAPQRPMALQPPECPQHHTVYWGVFQREPGYTQGAVTTDERLVGYIGLARRGNSAWYSHIMGHGEHLKLGVMYLLHYALVRQMMEARPPGLRYLIFFEFARRPNDVRVHWKSLLLFKPRYMITADDRRFAWPHSAAPDAAVARLALKTTIELPEPEAKSHAAALGVEAEWLALLHRAWIVEAGRAPGIVGRILREGVRPSLETLSAFAPRLFPQEGLAGMDRVAVVLDSRSCGIDTLFDLQAIGRARVVAYHHDAEERARLQAIYGERWAYAAPDGSIDADLVVAESAAALPENNAKRLIVAIDGSELKGTDDDALCARFSTALGRRVIVKGKYFRWGDPDPQSWVW
ncbi:MAG: hypothetical protein ACXWJV_07995, partial [Hyphomicrobium sp.]